MPQLPRGLIKRKIKTKRGTRVVYYLRVMREGRRVWRSLGSRYDLALTRFRELQDHETASPTSPPPSLAEFAERWLAEYAATQRTERGRAQAEQRFRVHVLPILGSKALPSITAADIRRLNAVLAQRSVGLVTRRRALEDLRCLLRYAVEEAEVLTKSPWKRGLLPSLPEAAPRPLSELEFAEVVGVVPGKWKPVVRFLAATGLRWGELRALRWQDVREEPYPHIVVSRSHEGPTKSRRVREVPLMPEAQDVLASLPRQGVHLFGGRGTPMLGETASFLRRYVAEHSWVTGFSVHRLRHTFACRWLEEGRSLEALQRVLGHSTIRLTERYGQLSGRAVAQEAMKPARVAAQMAAPAGSDRVSDGSATGIRTPV